MVTDSKAAVRPSRRWLPSNMGATLRRFPWWPAFLGAVVLGLVAVAVLGPLIEPHDPLVVHLREKNLPPAWFEKGTSKYLLGTDALGRDMLSRIIRGARTSLSVASIALVFGTVLGTGLGVVAGYTGGLWEELIMRFVDMWLALPFILVALVVAVTVGGSLFIMIGLLVLVSWPAFTRNIRAEVLSLKTRDYVSMAKVAGSPAYRIILKHILPNVVNTVIVIATLRVGQLILVEAALSFLGAGIPPPTPTWGSLVADGRNYLRNAWWISMFPGLAIGLLVMCLNFLGDWLRDRFDPRLRSL